MRAAVDQLDLGAGLPFCLDRLNAMQGAQLDASVQDLLHPISLAGVHDRLPRLVTLPLAAQTNLLLLLMAAPHRFSSSQRVALLAGFAQLAANSSAAQPSILQLLLSDASAGKSALGAPAIPACPSFLYTAQPCFPWAPVRADAATAADLQKQQADAAAKLVQQQQQQQLAGAKRCTVKPALQAGGRPAKRQCPMAAAAATAPAAAAGNELNAAISTVREALTSGVDNATPAAVTPALREALDVLLAHAAAGSTTALDDAGLGSLQDDSLLLLLLSEVVTPASSFARCRVAAAGLLLPRLHCLEGPASRDLAAAVEHLGSANPQALITACLHSLLTSPGLNKHQAELLSSTLKASLPQQLLPDVLAAACATASVAASGVGATPASAAVTACGAWNEHTVLVLQAVLNAKPVVSETGVEQLATAFLGASSATTGGGLAASVKFAKLVLSVVKQYPQQAAIAKQQLHAVAQACRSFMAKSLLAAVAKL